MSFALTPSKRPHDRSSLEFNGKGKWQKSANFRLQSQPLKISPHTTVFRVLCPSSKTGSVIGKGGTIVSQIRQETGAKVKVEDTVPGCDERVIFIAGSDKETEASNEQNKEGEDNNIAEESDEDKEQEEENSEKEQEENSENKEYSPPEDSQSEKATSSVQKALLLVFERMVEGEGEPESDGGDDESKKSSCSVVRLLVLSSQVGCLLGKGGSVIKQMAAESGAQIRILPRDKLPLCASPADELVQLTGGLDAVRKALQCVCQQLLQNPPRDRGSFSASKPMGPLSHLFGPPLPKSEAYPPSTFRFPSQGPYAAGPLDGGDYASPLHLFPGRMKPSQEILTFRLLCHNEKVGGLIGKGGTIIKTLQLETGCDVTVLEGVPDSEEQIIVISGPAIPDERISAAQDAVLRVQARLVRAVPDRKEKIVLAQLLVSSIQIGCLLGKGGAIIAEMRKLSGAQIRILGKDQVPKCASKNEEVVQITGEFEAVQEALLQITSRLKHHFFRDTFPSINHPPFPDQAPSFPPSYMGRRELSPPGMFPNLGPSFHKFEPAGGLPPHAGIHPHHEHSAFVHSMHRPGIPPHSSERLPSSAPWGPRARTDGGGLMGISEYPGGPQRRTGGYGGGSQPTIITNTTVEVVVPRSLVPSIYGEDGGCLKQIRQISGANITITEPRPGDTESLIIISGAPDQTHAAQSLLQAFVMSGADSS